jgi:hypothetical protein
MIEPTYIHVISNIHQISFSQSAKLPQSGKIALTTIVINDINWSRRLLAAATAAAAEEKQNVYYSHNMTVISTSFRTPSTI